MIIAYSHNSGNQDIKSVGEFLNTEKIAHRSAVIQGKSLFITQKNLSPAQKAHLLSLAPALEFKETQSPFALASLEWQKTKTVIDVKGARIGGPEISMIAGPCAVESEEQLDTIASYLQTKGIRFLRGGAYKPRTSPYNFQGLKSEGLRLLKNTAEKYQLRVVTELLDLSFLEEVYDHADVIQIGTRNMFNYQLLKELGKIDKPILLKRGFSAKVEEWLLAAEYILLGGNEKVILCERGIRSFETETRNTLDLGAVALVRELSHLPVITDPSQATGARSLVEPMTLASVAAGADGIMLEVHHDPDNALSDGPQSLRFRDFDHLLRKLKGTFRPEARTFDFENNSLPLPR